MDDEELNELFGMEDQADDGAAGNGGMFVVEDHGGKDEDPAASVDDSKLDELFGYDEPEDDGAGEDDAKARAKEEKLREKKAQKEQKKREKEARKEQKKREKREAREREEREERERHEREEREREERERIEKERAEKERAEKERAEKDEHVHEQEEREREEKKRRQRDLEQKARENREQEEDLEEDIFVHEHHEHHKHHDRPQSSLFKPKYVILAFLGVLLITGIVLIFTLDTFKILTINVEGNHVLKSEDLIELSGINTGDHIFFANYTKAARDIKNSSMYVKDCKVSFELPSKVNIKIEERSKICYVKTPDGYAALDDEGTVIELSSFDYEGKIAPVISGLNITHAMLGNKIVIGNESDYQKSLIVLGSLLSADKNNQSRTYSIFENTEEVRVLPSGYIFLTIKLPNGNLLQVKFDSLEKISSQTAWLLYAIDAKVFDKGFQSGSLDMTLEEPVYRQFDIRENLTQDGLGDDTPDPGAGEAGEDDAAGGDAADGEVD